MKFDIGFILVLLLFVSCHKEINENDQYHPVTYLIYDTLKSQEFKEGSYWIYQNDSTSQTDCSYVYQVQSGKRLVNSGVTGMPIWVEYYDIYYHNTYSASDTLFDWDKIEQFYIYRNPQRGANNSFYGTIIYWYDKEPGITWGKYPKTLDSLQVGINKFYNVQKAGTYYSVTSIGNVKRFVYDSINYGDWNLIRWKINK